VKPGKPAKAVSGKKRSRLDIWTFLLDCAERVQMNPEHVAGIRARGGSEKLVAAVEGDFEAARAEVVRVIKNTHLRGRKP